MTGAYKNMDKSRSPIPLRPAQEPYLRGQLAHPDSLAYAVANLMFYEAEGLTSDMVWDCITQAIDEATSIHYYLTRDDEGSWWNVLGTSSAESHQFVDLSDSDDPAAAMRELVDAQWQTPIPILGPGVSHRSVVAKLGEGRYAWFGGCHHAAIDGWGGMLLRRRASELIAAAVAGLDAPPRRTGTFEHFATETSRSTTDPGSVHFWLAQLENMPRTLSFSDRTAPPADLPIRRVERLPIATLDNLGAESGASWRDFTAALVLSYIRAMTQENAVIAGFPVSGRHTPLAKANHATSNTTLPLRVAFEPGDTIFDISRRFRATLKASYQHQDVLLSDLANTDPSLFLAPRLFGPLVNIIPFHDAIEYGTLDTQYEVWSYGPIDDFSLTIQPTDSLHLEIEMLANPRVYTADECAAHARRFMDWCGAIIADPTAPLDSLVALTADEAGAHELLSRTRADAEKDSSEWGAVLTPHELAGLAQHTVNADVSGLKLVGPAGFAVPAGRVGRVIALTDQGERDTGLRASLELVDAHRPALRYHGRATDVVRARECDVEKGAVVQAVREFAQSRYPGERVGYDDVEVGVGKHAVTATVPWELTAQDTRHLRELVGRYTPARIRFANASPS